MTLVEVMIAMAMIVMVFCGIIGLYVHTSYKAEWSGYSLAAQALAIQQLEQAKSAVWDPRAFPPKNEITNLTKVTAAVLDLPISGTNITWATNRATVTEITTCTTPLVTTYLVRVDTVWPFRWRNRVNYYTNTLATYLAPD